MIVHANVGSRLTRPAVHEDVRFLKVYNDDGQLLLIAQAIEGGGTFVITADDPKFQSVLKQYGLKAVKTELLTV